MDFLTENDIKHAALRFLKSHYKYRPRIGDSQARLDNITKSGIIADGLLSFQTDISKKFEATFEATSYAKSHEVKYKVKESRLWWDSIMVGFIITTIIFAILYNGQHLIIGAERVFLAIVLLLVSIIFYTMLYRLTCKSFSSYRQIYALEQFKLYDADEQWVAVGYDVFENPEDKYLKELKRQCVLYGFGLMLVDKDLDIRQSITPSLVPLEGKKRREAQFVALEDNKAQDNNLTGRIKNYTDSFATSLGWEKEKRFRYNFIVQFLMIALCITLMSLMIWKETKKTKEDVVDNSEYRKKIKEQVNNTDKEGNFYIIDEEAIVKFDDTVDEYDLDALQFYEEDEIAEWYNQNHQDSLYQLLNDSDTRNRNHILDSLKKEQGKEIAQADLSKNNDTAKGGNTKKKKSEIPSVCKEYASWGGSRYILKDGVYNSRRTAEYRISQINLASAMAGIIRGGCFKGTKSYYIVYVDAVYTNKNKAVNQLPYFDQLLKDQGYSSGDLELMKLNARR